MLDENELGLRVALVVEPPAALDAATLAAIRRDRPFVRPLWRRIPLAASIALVLGAAVVGMGEFRRASANLDMEGEMFLEMTCMAAVSDFYGDFED